LATVNQILESYFSGLYHLSHSPNLTKETIRIPEIRTGLIGKPIGGFWLAKGLSWHKWSTENFGDFPDDHLYRVKLNPRAKIFQVNTKNFNKLFNKNDDSEWNRLTKKYDGIQVYNLKNFDIFKAKGTKNFIKLASLAAYDVPTVLIWNRNIIQSMEHMGTVREIAEKKHKERMVKKSKDKINGTEKNN